MVSLGSLFSILPHIMPDIPYFVLPRTGDHIPAVGFGSGTKHKAMKFNKPEYSMTIENPQLTKVFIDTIGAGFNHLDTAECYLTRLEIGKAVNESGVDRSKMWITDKYDQGWVLNGILYRSNSPSGPYSSLKKGLKLMNLDYIDLFLIHGPYFMKATCNVTVEDAWLQMERLLDEGLTRNIGVSNFDIPLLKRVLKVCKYKPQVDQIEYHLYLQQEETRNFCKENDILVEGFAPLTPIIESKVGHDKPLEPVIKEMCQKYNVEANQLLLRWNYQSGVLPITTSSNIDRMKNTFKMFDFVLEKDDFDRLKEVGKRYHYRGFFNDYFERSK
ncbi:hypothetical protein FOA43_001875 [Brettanomyces nanus]|uniref:NADP-dependent oxidoreductase domain-containing protein n=1 Tax=Eeniella nana TaxID=13502 RepID=A0A875S5S5_EENNA|nr:uncharacterized protein FOA43_001875 [Brettanomyces nanus]QPG74544.1 hypothetical protein FOA43_001875 [Brettanomyces nanus]